MMDNWARLRILGASAIGGYVLYKIYVSRRRQDAGQVKKSLDVAHVEATVPVATKPFAAFISHYKAEAAMEARFLQRELQLALSGRRCFLDSDDLHDLKRLKDAVLESDVLVVLQSAHLYE